MEPGHTVEDYRLERLVGTSGMCDVYEATHARTGQRAAVKLHRSPQPDGDRRVERLFRREALAARLVDHPAVVKVFGVGLWLGHQYLLMEFVSGDDLVTRVHRERRLAPAEAVRIGAEIAGAMRVAHERGVIHGDLKPANVLLSAGPSGPAVRIVSFSYPPREGDEPEDTAPFSLAFASPEQIERRRVEKASDVYSLGATLAFMLGVPPPYHAQPSVEALGADVPPELAALVRQMMAPHAEERPAMSQVADALSGLRRG